MKKLTLLCLTLLMISSCAYSQRQLNQFGWNHRRPAQSKQVAATKTSAPVAITGVNARYKIALLVPLTGKSAHIGKSMADAAQLAVMENGSHDFQAIAYDTGDSSDGAAEAADKAIAEGANIILGPIFSDKVGKVAARAKAADIKVIAFSNNKAVAGGNVYILGLVPDQQVARVLKYANERGINGFSAVLPNNVFGNQVAEVLAKETEFFGADIRKISLGSDSTIAAKEIADAYQAKSITPDRKVEAILIPEGAGKAVNAAAALKKNGIGNVRYLGTALWDNEATITNAGLRGAWFASTPYENADAFTGRFMTQYNYKPDDIAGLGYDAAKLAMETADSGFSDSDLHRSRGFTGVKGVYKFDGSNVDIRGYTIYEIRDSRAYVADPAPDHF